MPNGDGHLAAALHVNSVVVTHEWDVTINFMLFRIRFESRSHLQVVLHL